MIRHCPSEEDSCALLVDGVTIVFSRTLDDIKVSTHTSRSRLTRTAGGLWSFFKLREVLFLFTDLKSLSSKANVTPMQ